MTSLNLRADIYDPKTLAAMDQAFAAVWHMLRTDKPFRDYANDTQLKMVIGKKLLNLVVDGDGSEISPWKACFCHVIEERSVLASLPQFPRRRLRSQS